MTWRLIGLLAVASVTSSAHADERSKSLVTAFQEFCTLPLPSFEELDAKANGQNLSVHWDLNSPPIRSKIWSVESSKGPYQLSASKNVGKDGQQRDVCGLSARDANGEDVKTDLVRALQLNSPPQQIRGGWFHGQGTISFWRKSIAAEEVGISVAENPGGTQMAVVRSIEARP